MHLCAGTKFLYGSIWAAVLLTACGGGGGGSNNNNNNNNNNSDSSSSNTTPAGTAPTVTINSTATDSGQVLFSFVFSQDVGNSFTASAVQVSGGSTAVSPVLSRTDATHYSMVVTPATSATAVSAGISAGAFRSTASVANTSAASASYPASSDYALACGKAVPQKRSDGRSLVWHDEFCDTQGTGLPDSSKWGYDTFRNSLGWYNNELQYYAEARKENSSVANGVLSINARRESASPLSGNRGQAYTSARLITLSTYTFTYGFVEVRAKLPCSQGTWPAIWMLGSKTGTGADAWPAHGEIDIMEQGGFAPGSADWSVGTIHGTVHLPLNNGNNGGAGVSGKTTVSDSCGAFHNYQVSWTPNNIAFSIDGGTPYHTYARPANATAAYWPFDGPQYLILNVAMGGTLGGTVPSTFVNDSMQVRWVRVYR